MAAMVLLAASCSNESVENLVENNANQPTAPVRVSVNDFSMSMSEVVGARGFTRSEVDPATYNGVGAMTLAFYNSEGTEVYKSTQIKNDGSTFTTFGSFSANLPIGTYTMVALGYTFVEGDGFRLTSSTEAAFPANVNFRITAWQQVQYENRCFHFIRHSSDIREIEPFPLISTQR